VTWKFTFERAKAVVQGIRADTVRMSGEKKAASLDISV